MHFKNLEIRVTPETSLRIARVFYSFGSYRLHVLVISFIVRRHNVSWFCRILLFRQILKLKKN
jgi:hypothetical protein